MRVRVVKKDGTSVIYRNITEIHYGFDADVVAYESDIHNTGIVRHISKIFEFEAKQERKLAKDFDERK